MDRKTIAAIWSFLSLVALYYALNTYLVSQGMNTLFGSPVLDARPRITALFGIVIVSLLLIPAGLIGALHAWRHGSRWHDRIPLALLKRLDTTKWEGKVYQAVALFIAIALPIGSLVHFWDKIDCKNCIFDTKNPHTRCAANVLPADCRAELKMVEGSIWTFQKGSGSDRFRFGVDPGKDFGRTNGGVSFVPGLTPFLLLVVSLLSLLANAWFVLIVFGRRPERGNAQLAPDP